MYLNALEEPETLTLAEACKITPYTQEYLSLLARKGALGAHKQGRNWVVTKRELDRYLRSVEVKTANIIGYDLFTHNSGFTHKPSIHRLFARILSTSSRREVQANLKTKMGICGRHPQFSYIRVFRTV